MAARRHRTFREADLYPPLHDYLAAQGYTVRAEVRDCDVVATKGEELIAIELKRRFCTHLLVQATRRQRFADSVYVALPRPPRRSSRAQWRGQQHLLRRLELGLILVSPHGRRAGVERRAPSPAGLLSDPRAGAPGAPFGVEVLFHPLPYARQRRNQARRAILQEVAGRSGDYNQGGSTGHKILTAYRENVILIACCLDARGPLAPRELRALGTGPKTLSIVASDFYGWFERVAHGVYGLKAAGRAALAQYPELVARFRARLTQSSPAGNADPQAGTAGLANLGVGALSPAQSLAG